jgi:hypothetical protein
MVCGFPRFGAIMRQYPGFPQMWQESNAGLWQLCAARPVKSNRQEGLRGSVRSGVLGQAGNGGNQHRAEHEAYDADDRKNGTLEPGQALAFWVIKKSPKTLC